MCSIDIDKMWDVLHFLLTGISATEPIEDDPLSELIAGEIVADEEDFIAYTTPQKVQELAGVMSEINKEFLPRSRRTRTCRPGFNLLTVRLFRIIIFSIASLCASHEEVMMRLRRKMQKGCDIRTQ